MATIIANILAVFCHQAPPVQLLPPSDLPLNGAMRQPVNELVQKRVIGLFKLVRRSLPDDAAPV